MRNKLIVIFLSLLFGTTSILGAVGFVHNKAREEIDRNFTLNGDEKVTLEYGTNYIDDGYTLSLEKSDPKVIVIDNTKLDKVGTYKIKYIVNYKGYKKVLTREVTVVDTVAPTIELECEDDINLVLGGEFKYCDYNVVDNYDKDLNQKMEIISNVNTNKVGDYKVKYSVSDSSNNKTTKEVNVHVKEKKDLYYILVSISEQRLRYYENGKVVLETPVTTGKKNKTPTGNFKILKKVKNAVLKGANYSSFVKYWMAFKGSGYGIHDASWRHNFGNMNYYNNGSHGCINVPLKAIKQLYDLVEVGTPVYIKQ